MRSPRANSAGPMAAGATASTKLGSVIDANIAPTGPAAQQIGRPRLTLIGDAADRAARALAGRRSGAAVAAMTWPAAQPPPPTPMSPTPAETLPLPKATRPAEVKRPRFVHQPADAETIAWNQAHAWPNGWRRERRKKAHAEAVVDMLATRLRDMAPLVFGDEAVPLKVGIHHDIAADLTGAADKETIRRFLQRWTRRNGYLRAIARGENWARSGRQFDRRTDTGSAH